MKTRVDVFFWTQCICSLSVNLIGLVWVIIIIIKNECHSNIIVDRLQGCRVNELIGVNTVKVEVGTARQFPQSFTFVWCNGLTVVHFLFFLLVLLVLTASVVSIVLRHEVMSACLDICWCVCRKVWIMRRFYELLKVSSDWWLDQIDRLSS